MTIFTLVTYIGIVALLVTLIMGLGLKVVKSWPMSFLQNFAGILFIFSGWVKAIDPMGTAFKMEQYFEQFEVVFSDTFLKFMSPIFPVLSEYSTAFSLIMIIFEIVLGIMLVIGAKPKFTAWAFLILVLFFTVLTGFTFLTGYVPEGVNFFSFGDWGAYNAKNMKVTDCGCFGDFIKLEPRISFFKDIFLMIPAIYFVLKYKSMHQWLSGNVHNILMASSTLLLLLYCFNNFYWNEPHIDFRPFTIGADITNTKLKEQAASAAVKVTGFVLKNKQTGELKELAYEDYMKNFASYSKEEWETVDQIKTEPTMKATKISEFDIKNYSGDEVTDLILDSLGTQVMIVSYKPYYAGIKNVRMISDTLFTIDTIALDNNEIKVVKAISKVEQKEETYYDIVWDDDYINTLVNIVKPFTDAAIKEKVKIVFVTGGLDQAKAQSLKDATGIDAQFYTADDILIKTIMRSNPGVLLWKDGVILNKWHYKKLPNWEVAKTGI